MLHSRWQLAVSDKPIHVNSILNGCYAAVAAASGPAASALPGGAVYRTLRLRQDGLHVGIMLATMNSFNAPWMTILTEVKPSATSRSQALMGLRERRRVIG